MTTEWTELKTGKEVFDRQADGWEIEFRARTFWDKWDGELWIKHNDYRGRPAQPKEELIPANAYGHHLMAHTQPKTKTVTSECWRNKENGYLHWVDPDAELGFANVWQRFPAGDLTGEVED